MRAISRCIPQFVKTPFIQLGVRRPEPWALECMRQVNRIQLSRAELSLISQVIVSKRPCRMLVFGLGNDAPFWTRLNEGGTTVFLEDNKIWLDIMMGRDSQLSAFLVDYQTSVTKYKELLADPSSLGGPLVEEVEKEKWDIIFVDAPDGSKPDSPGRMRSIYMASQLVSDDGDIFVHDCDREIEKACCDQFLGSDNLRAEVALLRHYRR